MATFEASTHPLAFAHMEGGMKTVFVMPYSDEFAMVSSGDRIEFDDLGSITIGCTGTYAAGPSTSLGSTGAGVVAVAQAARSIARATSRTTGT